MWMDETAVAAVEAAEEGVVAVVGVIVVAAAGWMSWWHRSGWNSWRGAQGLKWAMACHRPLRCTGPGRKSPG